MSREIKFRAWDKQDKKMYSMVNDYFSGRTIWYLNTQECESEFEIMQFTGLKDKNGVEIYEKDYVRLGRNGIFIIDFTNGKFEAFYLNSDGSYDDEFEDGLANSITKNIEVVGNKFVDNKKILKEINND